MKRFIICLVACTQLTDAEDVTLAVQRSASGFSYSEPITLNQGDSATLIFAGASGGGNDGYLVCNIGSMTFNFSTHQPIAGGVSGLNPVAIAGPATIVLRCSSDSNLSAGLATFRITRAGIASPPAAIPQEADTKWDVILESSSDLVNWTPANPGEYTGTEPKRFFRTRMVKKP